MKPLALPPPLAAELKRQALQSPDREICGLISGDKNGFKRCYPVANVAPDPTRRFEMDPRGQIDALRAMTDNGETLEAIYHSHPDGPPFPSAIDIAQHQYPDALFIVISLVGSAAPELRGFFIRDRRVEEIDLDIENRSVRDESRYRRPGR